MRWAFVLLIVSQYIGGVACEKYSDACEFVTVMQKILLASFFWTHLRTDFGQFQTDRQCEQSITLKNRRWKVCNLASIIPFHSRLSRPYLETKQLISTKVSRCRLQRWLLSCVPKFGAIPHSWKTGGNSKSLITQPPMPDCIKIW